VGLGISNRKIILRDLRHRKIKDRGFGIPEDEDLVVTVTRTVDPAALKLMIGFGLCCSFVYISYVLVRFRMIKLGYF
jgi:hypothetical protein